MFGGRSIGGKRQAVLRTRGEVLRTARQVLAVAATLAVPLGGVAQMHKVAKPEQVVRAIGVYEWTGDMAKPNAMRLIPVSLFIDNHFEDAGVYLARPIPFALDTGTVYEAEQAGVPKGQIDLRFARHFETSAVAEGNPFDDGWFGYGRFVVPAPPKQSKLRQSATMAKVNGIDDEDDTRPHFSSRSAAPGSGSAAAGVPSAPANSPGNDPDRPTLHKGGSSGSGSGGTDTAGSNPPADPDRPTLHRGSNTSSEDADIQDPDQPTLRRRSPADAAAAKANTASDTPSLNDDPNRPRLHRGKPEGEATADDLPKLSGLPGEKELHQMAAVSDAADRPVHDFARAWDSDSDRADVLAKMEQTAQAQLAAYEGANGGTTTSTAPPPGDARHPNSKLRHGVTPDTKPAAPEKLEDEQLNAYTLTYGGPATYVYTAHTDGLGATLRYVTLVAEVDMQGNPQFAIKSVTDAAHLDRAPRMRLIDAVDPDASNRASLLFELREANARQFALYRVIGGHSDQIFATGTTQ